MFRASEATIRENLSLLRKAAEPAASPGRASALPNCEVRLTRCPNWRFFHELGAIRAADLRFHGNIYINVIFNCATLGCRAIESIDDG
jgi:hypothetical protein